MSVELLAPAKDLLHGIAAINHGADAVYIGSPRFGARKNAANSIEDIESLCKYAHKYNGKVYVALNTLLKENELLDAEKIIHQVYNAGADAIIIQDMGILEMELPPIEIHASTQTHNISAEKVLFFEKCGIKRVILARELSIAEIKSIRTETTVELESFIHGAICVSYSGQCYISHSTTNRSGNRGECSQLCRTSFSLCDSAGKYIIKDKHLLSLKDLNLTNNLSDMLDAGISSLKIEGRLKDMSYLKNITSHYRKVLDTILEEKHIAKASSGYCNFTFTPDTEATFTRQYTPYFIDGNKKQMASFDSPKAIGKTIGIVSKIGNNFFEISGQPTIANNDGLCFFDRKGELLGIKVNSVINNKIFPQHRPSELTIGTTIYRNNDVVFDKQLAASSNPRKIIIDILLEETLDGIKLSFTDEDNTKAIIEEKLIKELAQNQEASINSINTQLQKTGNSIFEVRNCCIQFETALFIRTSIINELRRKAIEQLEQNRSSNYKRNEAFFSKTDVPFSSKSVDFTTNILNTKAEAFYRRHGVTEIEKGFELLYNFAGKTVMTTKYCLRNELGICLIDKTHKQPEGIQVPLFLENKNQKFRLDFDCKRCEMKVVYI